MAQMMNAQRGTATPMPTLADLVGLAEIDGCEGIIIEERDVI